MGTFLTQGLPVGLSGSLGLAGNFNLFACTEPNIVLYVSKSPLLLKDAKGKPAASVTTYTSQLPDRSVKIIGGASAFSVITTPQLDKASIDQAKAMVAALGVADPNRVRFLPLTTQKGKAMLNLPTAAGAADKAHNDRDVGTPGGNISFLANLTETGALEWSTAIKNRSKITGDVTIQYEYLRMLPDVGAEVHVWGRRVFEHLSTALNVSYNGFLYGGSAKLEAAWNDMTRNGAVEVVFIGQGLPPELEKLRQEMTTTFAKQAMQILFDQIFAPMPAVAPAQAGSSGGLFGGANFALKWQKTTDTIDLSQTIKFKGMTWLTETMDASLAELFADLDPSCLTEVPAQQAFDSSIVVDSDPMLSNVAVSLSYSEGHSPEAPVFTKEGGHQRYTVVSTNPANVAVNCDVKIDYSPPRWPIIPYSIKKSVGQGGNQMVIKTSAWVGRQTIFMFVRDGNTIVPPDQLSPNDYLILNVSYQGPHLPDVVRDSAHLDGLSSIDFSYPLNPDPHGQPGVAKFSAFGVIGGQLVRAPEQVIPQTDTSVFILATKDGKIQLVTSQSVLNESDSLAQDLILGQGRPLVQKSGGPASEATAPGKKAGSLGPASNGKTLSGRTVGIEYGTDGTSLWVRLSDGSAKRVRLHSVQESLPFEKDSRLVKVLLDKSGDYAESIFLDVAAL